MAAGTYKPTDGTDREEAFVMREGVVIYGGFAGTETSLNARNWDTNKTILSGDIGTDGDSSDNSYHVVAGANNATIDGFTIQGGNANGQWHNSRGGGLFCYESTSPAVSNCTFTNNSAVEGGGIVAYISSAPTITNCAFTSNSAENAAAILFRVGPDTQDTGSHIYDTTFENNTATDRGGAVYLDYGAWSTFESCTFNSNTSQGNGGAMYIDSNSSQAAIINSWFDDCAFTNNTSTTGRGGAFAIYEGTAYITESTITDNSAATGGGGIAVDYRGKYELDNSTVSGNSTTTGEADIDDDTL